MNSLFTIEEASPMESKSDKNVKKVDEEKIQEMLAKRQQTTQPIK